MIRLDKSDRSLVIVTISLAKIAAGILVLTLAYLLTRRPTWWIATILCCALAVCAWQWRPLILHCSPERRIRWMTIRGMQQVSVNEIRELTYRTSSLAPTMVAFLYANLDGEEIKVAAFRGAPLWCQKSKTLSYDDRNVRVGFYGTRHALMLVEEFAERSIDRTKAQMY